jgi:hypothetical protein
MDIARKKIEEEKDFQVAFKATPVPRTFAVP